MRNDQIWAARLACMLAVDDMLDKVVQELTAQGAFSNTYIVYMSDNGLLMGQHRLVRAKDVAYEESIKVPFYVTGPGVPAGQTRPELVANIDLAPTFVEWSRAPAPDLDGRSLVPLLTGSGTVSWRTDLLFEHWVTAKPDADLYGVVPTYGAVRSAGAIYVEYENDIQDREFYDLGADPYELHNLYYQTPAPAGIASLAARLALLKACRGLNCRS